MPIDITSGAGATTAYVDAKVADVITDAVTTIAPSENAVFDALALKAPLVSPSFTTPNLGVAAATSMTVSGITTGLTKVLTITHASGVHDGANNAAVMTDSGETLGASALVGMTVYNITDASSGTITANTDTTITATLAGGTDNDWDTSDVWQVGPGPNQSGSIFVVSLASTIRHPAAAGYSAMYYANGAVVLTVDMASNAMVVELDATPLSAGNAIDSSGTTQDCICLLNLSTTLAATLGRRGTWIDGGAT